MVTHAGVAHQQARGAGAGGTRQAGTRRGGRRGRRRLGAVPGLARVLERLVLGEVLVDAVVQLRGPQPPCSVQVHRATWQTCADAATGTFKSAGSLADALASVAVSLRPLQAALVANDSRGLLHRHWVEHQDP